MPVYISGISLNCKIYVKNMMYIKNVVVSWLKQLLRLLVDYYYKIISLSIIQHIIFLII